MDSWNYKQLDLPVEVEQRTTRPVKSPVIDTCARLVSQNGLRSFRWSHGNRWAVCFELPIQDGRHKPTVWLEDIMSKRELCLTSCSMDVALDSDEREAVKSVQYLWKLEYPQNKCQILFRSEYVRIRKRVSYSLLEEKPLFERRLIEGIVGIRQAMEYLFPLVAKNITFLHRESSSWPQLKRIEL
jgi:hypothetical protein